MADIAVAAAPPEEGTVEEDVDDDDVEACCEATPLTGALRPGFGKDELLYPGISALRTSGPPLDHGAQRGRLLLASRRASSSSVVVGSGESVGARVRDPIGASTCAKGADGG